MNSADGLEPQESCDEHIVHTATDCMSLTFAKSPLPYSGC